MSRLSEMIARLCPNGVEYRKLGEICESGLVKIARGNVISKKDIQSNPGDYPIYSSSAMGDGEFGRYGKYMFDEELVTWSIDGGGKFFYRGKKKFSVTNVCGYIRVENSNVLLPKFLYHVLASQWAAKSYDYVHKALPSTIIDDYSIPLPPLEIQREVVEILDNFANLTAELTAELAKRKKQYEHYRDSLFDDSPRMEYLKLDAIAETTVGLATSVTPFIRDNGVLLIHNSDIQQNAIVMKQLVYLDQAFVAKNSKKKFNLNDIVTVHTGDVGTSALITDEYVGSIGFTTLRSRIRDVKKVYPAYLCHYLNSHRCKEAIASKTISDRSNLNQGSFAELIIPLPPLAEQKRIVAILDRFDSLCNSLTEGLPAEIALRKKQYEYYRDKLLSFKEAS